MQIQMSSMPDLKERIGLAQRVSKQNQFRILRTSFRQINNLMKLDRFGEAEYRARILGGILRTWEMQTWQSFN